MTNDAFRSVFLLSFTLFLLSSKHIKRFYLCLVSIIILLASNYSNKLFIAFLNSYADAFSSDDEEKISIFNNDLIKASFYSYVAQVCILSLFFSLI